MIDGPVPSVFDATDVYVPTNVHIHLAENGFKMNYGDKDFIANTMDEMLKTVEKWFKDSIKAKELKIK